MSADDRIPKVNKANKAVRWADKQGHNQALVVNELVGVQEGITQVVGWTIGDPGLHQRAGFRKMLPLHLRISARVHRVSFLHPSLDQELPMKKLGAGTGDFTGDVSALLENERYRLSRDGIVGNHMKRKRKEEEKNKKQGKKRRSSLAEKESDKPTNAEPKGARRLIVMSSPPPSTNKKKSNVSPIKFEQLLDRQNKCAKLIGDDSIRRRKYVTREISTRFESEEIAGTGTEFAAYLKVATTPEIYGDGRFLPQVACRVPRSSVCFEMRCRSDNTVKSTQPFVVEAPHVIWGGAKDKLFSSIADDGSPLIDARNLEYLTNSELKLAGETESLLIMGTTVYVDFFPDPVTGGPTFKGTKKTLKKGAVITTKKTIDFTKKVGGFAGKALHSLDKKHPKNGDNETQSDESASNHDDVEVRDNQHVKFANHDDVEGGNHDDVEGGNHEDSERGSNERVEGKSHGGAESTVTIHGEGTKMNAAAINMYGEANDVTKKTVVAVEKLGKKMLTATTDAVDKATNTIRPQKESDTRGGNVDGREGDAGSAVNNEDELGQQSSATSVEDDTTGDHHNTTISEDTKKGTDEAVYQRTEEKATKPDIGPSSSSRNSPTKHEKMKNIFKKATKGLFSLGHKQKKNKKKEGSKISGESDDISVASAPNNEKEGSKINRESDDISVASAPPIVGSSGFAQENGSQTKVGLMPALGEDDTESKPQLIRSGSLSDINTNTDALFDETRKGANVSSIASTSKPSVAAMEEDVLDEEELFMNEQSSKESSTSGAKNAGDSLDGSKKVSSREGVEFSEENDKGKGLLEPLRKMGVKSADNAKELGAKGAHRVKEIGAKGSHDAKEIGAKGAHNTKRAAVNVGAGAKKLDDKLDEMDKKYREKVVEEKKVELPQPKPYKLVLDEVIDFCVVGFPTEKVLATFPISVASILNSRTMEERQSNPLQPSEMTVTLVQEPSTADGNYGVEAVVTFRVAEVQPRTPLALEEPERDDEGKKVTSLTKLKRLNVRLHNIGKSREEISEMVAKEEERLAAEAEAREQAIVEAGIGRGYEQGAPRKEIVQRQMFYDPEIHPHFSRKRRDNRIKLKEKDIRLRVDARSFLMNLNIHEESGSLSGYSLSSTNNDDVSTEEVEETPSTFLGAPQQFSNETTDTNLVEHSFTPQETVGWSVDGSAKTNSSAPQRGNLEELQMKSMWKSITDSEYKKMALLTSKIEQEETSSVESMDSDNDSSSDENEADTVPQSSELPMFSDPDNNVLIDSSRPSRPVTLQSTPIIIEDREGDADVLLPTDVPSRNASEPNVDIKVPSVAVQEKESLTGVVTPSAHGAQVSEVPPQVEDALSGTNALPRETRSLHKNSVSEFSSKTAVGGSIFAARLSKTDEFQHIDSFIQNKRQNRASTLPKFMKNTSLRQSSTLDVNQMNNLRRSTKLPSSRKTYTEELKMVFGTSELEDSEDGISVEEGVNPNSEDTGQSLSNKDEKGTPYSLILLPLLLGLLMGYFSRYLF